MGTVLGVIKHSKLMELKNSGIADEKAYLRKCVLKMELNRQRCAEKHKYPSLHALIQGVNPSIYKNIEYFNAYTSWGSTYLADSVLFLSEEEKSNLQFLQRARNYSKAAEKVLEGFRTFDEIYVDSYTGKAVDWLLHNKQKLKDLLKQEG